MDLGKKRALFRLHLNQDIFDRIHPCWLQKASMGRGLKVRGGKLRSAGCDSKLSGPVDHPPPEA